MKNQQDVQNQAQGEAPGRGVFGRIGSVISHTLGGAVKGMFSWGAVLLGLQLTGAARPLAQALGGDAMAETVANMWKTGDDHVPSMGKGILTSGLLGAVMGGAGAGLKEMAAGGDSDPAKKPGMLAQAAGIATSLVAAAVVLNVAKGGSLPAVSAGTKSTTAEPRGHA